MSFLNLKNFWPSIKRDKYLLAALLLGLLLRGLNSTIGSPSIDISNDESIAHLSALNMIAQRTPVSIANYTPFGSYLQIPFLVASYLFLKVFGSIQSVGEFELFTLTHEGYFLFIPRLISVFFSTATILLVYKLTVLLFKEKRAAIVAAFLTATSFNLVHIAHFGRPWSAALFFFLLSFYFACRKNVGVSFVLAAISYGFHQVGIFALPLILLATEWRQILKNWYFVVIAAVLVVFSSLLTLKIGFVDSLARDQSFIKSDKFLAQLILGKPDLAQSLRTTIFDNLSLYYINNLTVTDFVILLFGFVGLTIAFWQAKHTQVITLFIASYFLFASLFFHPLIRYLIPALILLIPFGGYFLSKLKLNNIVLAFVIALSSVNSLWWNYLYFQKPTFIQAREWIKENVDRSVPVMFVGGRFNTFAPDKQSILYTQKFNPNAYVALNQRIGTMPYDNTRNIFYLAEIQNTKNKFFFYVSDYAPAYTVNFYFSEKDSLARKWPTYFEKVVTFNPSLNKDDEIAETLFDSSWNFETSTPRRHPSMFSLSRTGPIVEIVRVIDWNFPQE